MAVLVGICISMLSVYEADKVHLLAIVASPGVAAAMLLDLSDVHGGYVFLRIAVIANTAVYSSLFFAVARIVGHSRGSHR